MVGAGRLRGARAARRAGRPEPARLSGRGPCWGVAGVRGGAARSTPPRRAASALGRRRRSWRLLGRQDAGARGRPDSRDRDRIGIRCETPALCRPAAAPVSAVAGRARSHVCPTRILGPHHLPASAPPARPAVGLDGHDRGRQGSPSRCSYWAVRLAAALTKSRPRRSLRCWPGLPPTRPPHCHSRVRSGHHRRQAVGQRTAMPAGTRPAPPSPAGPADGEYAAEDRGGVQPPCLRRPGRPPVLPLHGVTSRSRDNASGPRQSSQQICLPASWFAVTPQTAPARFRGL
jgi:hypothetical protein